MRKYILIIFVFIYISINAQDVILQPFRYTSAVKISDTVAKINLIPMAGYAQSGWQAVIAGTYDPVSVQSGVTINFPNLTDGDETGVSVGTLWAVNVWETYWRINQSVSTVYMFIISGLTGCDSVKVNISTSRDVDGTRPLFAKFNSNGTEKSLNACRNATGLIVLDHNSATPNSSGTDTIFVRSDGTNYAHVNAYQIIRLKH
jgi:hypothetical protein